MCQRAGGRAKVIDRRRPLLNTQKLAEMPAEEAVSIRSSSVGPSGQVDPPLSNGSIHGGPRTSPPLYATQPAVLAVQQHGCCHRAGDEAHAGESAPGQPRADPQPHRRRRPTALGPTQPPQPRPSRTGPQRPRSRRRRPCRRQVRECHAGQVASPRRATTAERSVGGRPSPPRCSWTRQVRGQGRRRSRWRVGVDPAGAEALDQVERTGACTGAWAQELLAEVQPSRGAAGARRRPSAPQRVAVGAQAEAMATTSPSDDAPRPAGGVHDAVAAPAMS